MNISYLKAHPHTKHLHLKIKSYKLVGYLGRTLDIADLRNCFTF